MVRRVPPKAPPPEILAEQRAIEEERSRQASANAAEGQQLKDPQTQTEPKDKQDHKDDHKQEPWRLESPGYTSCANAAGSVRLRGQAIRWPKDPQTVGTAEQEIKNKETQIAKKNKQEIQIAEHNDKEIQIAEHNDQEIQTAEHNDKETQIVEHKDKQHKDKHKDTVEGP